LGYPPSACGQSSSFVATQPIVRQKDQMFIWSQQSGILGPQCGLRRGKSGPKKYTSYAGVAMTHEFKAPKGFSPSQKDITGFFSTIMEKMLSP
jgi:hypothetical protein